MRGYLVWAGAGAFVGTAAASFFAPAVLDTLLATTGAQDAMCQCSQLVHRTSTMLIQVQMTGAAVGGVLFPLCAWLVRRKFKKPTDAVAAA